ncbi:hypothetical protein ASPCADRAFT_204768 [Aspergillus carbonarius ITEM 5010]|uniref:Uncharacterized protein n=1 Tax=Aspergillus carbonarius (strain ITEM 5010) TaxID=602072 RepID=A0A1R3RXC4_ASPC5|nr:hypothetical protein ASPCADRAFT_204768 [Aspergillus carbonarius ITEM 5010]
MMSGHSNNTVTNFDIKPSGPIFPLIKQTSQQAVQQERTNPSKRTKSFKSTKQEEVKSESTSKNEKLITATKSQKPSQAA